MGNRLMRSIFKNFLQELDKDCNKVYDPIMEKYIDELKKRCDLI